MKSKRTKKVQFIPGKKTRKPLSCTKGKGEDAPGNKKKPSDFIKLQVLEAFKDATARDLRVHR